MMTQVPVEKGLFTWPLADGESPRLLGTRCTACGTHTFPAQPGCPRCTQTSMEAVELASRGSLWTWTVQGFPPKAPPYVGVTDPASFEPYGVGYVELPGQVTVEARLTESDPSRLEVGMPMELALVPLGVDDVGNPIVTFAFSPTTTEENQ